MSPLELAIVIVSVLVITRVIALIGGRGRAVASALLTVGLVVFFLLAVVMFVRFDRVREVDRRVAQVEWGPVEELTDQLATAEPLQLDTPDDTPSPSAATADKEKPKVEAEEAATAASAASDEAAAAEKAASEEPAPDDNRPDWVDAEPGKVGGVYRVPVTAGPWPTSEESMKALPSVVDAEIAKYAVSRTGHEAAAKLRLPRDYIMAHMIEKDIWEEPLKIDSFDEVKHMVGRDVWENSENAADGEWTQLHALVRFDDEVNRELDERWAGLLRLERLTAAGVLGAIVMMVLGTVYAYLQIDLKTGGAYRGRLRAGALAAILAVIAVVLLNHV